VLLLLYMKKYILEIIVFICGANLMIFELVGSRLLAPYLGSNIFVWSSIIGVILASLSVGYWLGGIISDKKATNKGLSIIILFLAIAVGINVFYKDVFLILVSSIFNLKLGAIVASLALFSSSSILFGIISPYVASLKLKKAKKVGSTVGNLYAISTAGSIFGTFLAGFFLIPKIGSANILILISSSLFLLAIISFLENKKYFKFILFFIFALVIFKNFSKVKISASDVNEDIDTSYSRIFVYDIKNEEGEMVRVLRTNPGGVQSHMIVKDPTRMLTNYGEIYDLVEYFNPRFKKTLLLGGGGYSYPKHFLEKFKNATMDVVEIDPQMTEISKKYFYLKENPRMNIIHQDARFFLNKNNSRYDAVFKDVFNSYHSIPFHLTTAELVRKEYDSLNDQGVIFVNIMASISGKDSTFLNLEFNTYKSVFPDISLFKVTDMDDNSIQNIVLVAFKNKKDRSFFSEDKELQKTLDKKIEARFEIKNQILTDNFAPVDNNSGAIF